MKLKNNKQIFTLKELFQEVYDYIINTKEIDNDLFCIYHDVFFTWLKDIKLKIDNIKIEEEIFFLINQVSPQSLLANTCK